MTESERKAINEVITNMRNMEKGMLKIKDRTSDISEELKSYQAIGTVKEFKDLKEKNTPKKLIRLKGLWRTRDFECPYCRNNPRLYTDCCEWCGQRLDWN